MWEYLRLLCFIIIPFMFSTFIGTSDYCEFLFGKYGRPSIRMKNVKNEQKKSSDYPIFIRPFKYKYGIEANYPKYSPRRKRFMFFLKLTRINCGMTYLLFIFITICTIFNLLSIEALKDIIFLKAITLDAFCILCCLPFGYIITLFINSSEHKHSYNSVSFWID